MNRIFLSSLMFLTSIASFASHANTYSEIFDQSSLSKAPMLDMQEMNRIFTPKSFSIKVEKDGDLRTLYICGDSADVCDLIGTRSYTEEELLDLSKQERVQATLAKAAVPTVAAAILALGVYSFKIGKEGILNSSLLSKMLLSAIYAPMAFSAKIVAGVVPYPLITAIRGELLILAPVVLYTTPVALFAKVQDDQADAISFVVGKEGSKLSALKTARILDRLLKKLDQ